MSIPDTELKEAFAFFDHDKKTFLDKNEFATMVRSLGQTPSNMELEQLAREFAGNGQINEETAKLMMEKIYAFTAKRDKNKLADAFKVFDPEDTGKIPFDLFKNEILTKIGEPMEEQEMADTLSNLEASGAKEGDDIRYSVFVDWIWDQLKK
eukprot:TRINITY_DN19_c0_g1_i1.p1 TRINITY_DN19_c0_g1~~TRINITY_DN19_c0_g1_i1.p1  ORF type:complete len:152 (+),score=55.00 TRINITY_DN19_c0_g1_i1:190-645(+)